MVGVPRLELGMHIGAGFTDPLSHPTWRHPDWLQRSESNGLPRGYEPRELPMLHAASKVRDLNSLACAPVHPRQRRIVAESRGVDRHTLRCLPASNGCRSAGPVDSPWRKAAVLIRSACAPGPLPTGADLPAGSLSVLADGGSTRSPCLAAPSVFKTAPITLPVHHPCWLSERDSNPRPRPSEGCAHPLSYRRMSLPSRARRPNRDSRATSRAGSSAGTPASPASSSPDVGADGARSGFIAVELSFFDVARIEHAATTLSTTSRRPATSGSRART